MEPTTRKEPADSSANKYTRSAPVEQWLFLLVVLAGFLTYLPSLSGPFHFDDMKQIAERESIRHLWPPSVALSGRRPIVHLSLAINYALGGLNTIGYRVFNVSIHVLAALVLYGIVRRTLMLKRYHSSIGSSATWLALAVALIWVVHPLQTQAISYIIQRAEAMMGLFYLLTVYCLLRSADSQRPRLWYAAMLVSCALGMGSKAVMVTAPVIILLFDRVFLSRSFKEAFSRRGILYGALPATWGILVISGVAWGVLDPHSRPEATVGFASRAISPLEYLQTQPGVLLHYLRLSFWPHPLCLDYGWPVARTADAIVSQTCVIGVLLIATVWALVRRAWWGFAGAWFFIILAPTSSFIPIKDPMFEHRMYLSLAAVIVVCVIMVYRVLSNLFERFSATRRARQFVTVVLLVAALTPLAGAAAARNSTYRSRVALWADVIAKRPANARGHHNLGIAFADEGRLNEAMAEYAEAIRIDPNYSLAHYSMGAAYLVEGDLDQAIRYLSRSIQLKPGYADAYNQLGKALTDQGRYRAAIAQFRQAVRLNPKYVEAHYNLGTALARVGENDEAMQALQKALQLRPEHNLAHVNLGSEYLKLGEWDKALEHFTEAIRIDPANANAYANMGVALRRLGRIEEAIEAYREALEIDPDHVRARNNLATALRSQGKLKEAIAMYREVVRLDSSLADAHYNLASTLAADSQLEEAIQSYERALQLNPNDAEARRELGEVRQKLHRTDAD